MYCLSHLLNTYSVRVLELNAVSRSTIFFKHLRGTSEHLCVCVLPADAIFLKAGKGESTETVMVICCSLVVELNTLVTTCVWRETSTKMQSLNAELILPKTRFFLCCLVFKNVVLIKQTVLWLQVKCSQLFWSKLELCSKICTKASFIDERRHCFEIKGPS